MFQFYGNYQVDPELIKVLDSIKAGTFGDEGAFSALISGIVEHGDYYLGKADW
jgi:starch phosphorylase